jgi:medium-chain acyl-[acyl-carrier-protein] hydrolase
VQLPGREARLLETPFNSLPPLVERLSQALLPYLDRPFALFGHSMGSVIAFELARFLRREHSLEPAYLFVSGRFAPQIPEPEPHSYDLAEPEFIEELRRLNGTPKEVLAHPELMQLITPMLRADFRLIQTYSYASGEPLSCAITAFGGLEDADVTREHLEGWREQTRGPFTLRMLPGDHFFLHTAQEQILRTISRQLRHEVCGERQTLSHA